MTRIILLLLVTLAGPFCTFTRASTLPSSAVPETSSKSVTDMTAVENQTPTSSPQENDATKSDPDATDGVFTTEAPTVTATKSPVTTANSPEESAAPTEAAKSTQAAPKEDATEATETIEATEAKTEVPVHTESESTEGAKEEEASGTGQLVGIVIGALIGVIVVIAIIILVVRRMGQYSP